jgi:hypothetical protein
MGKEFGTITLVICSAIPTSELWATNSKARSSSLMKLTSSMAGLNWAMLNGRARIFSKAKFKRWE